MDDKKLFDELVKRDILGSDVADKILKMAEAASRSAEDILYEEKAADEEAVAKTKSELLEVPYRKVDPQSIPNELMNLISYETSRTYRVVPIEKRDNMFIVGVLDPTDEQAKNALRFIAKNNRLNLGIYIVTPSVLRGAWNRYMPYESEIQSAVRELGDVRPEKDVVGLEETIRSQEEAPIIKIVASTLRQAVDQLASDVHIEPQRRHLRIRFRVDGDLKEVASMPAGLSQPIVSRIKVLAKLRLDEQRIPQDGRFRTVIFGRNIDFRVATFPTPTGEKVAIRVLDPTTGMKSLEELGLSDYNFNILDEAIMSPFGMVLITGPTGSGKTTTLYAILNRLNSDGVNIVSLEDPVEYFIDGVNQSQVVPGIGYSFSSGLRQILRQDPDIIMVGEIRDGETASLAVNAALTGHLMLSTLHTNNAVGVVPRLTDLEVPGFLLPSALNVMVAQRLVSKLCSNCRRAIEAAPQLQEIISESIDKLPKKLKEQVSSKFRAPYEVYKPEPKDDCEECGGKGTSGRVAIFELFKMTKELGNLVTQGYTEANLWEEANRQNMVTLRQDGIIKSLEGRVLVEEILKETEEYNQ